MQFIEFQITDKQMLAMGRNPDGSLDVARQTREMTLYMEQLANERAERDRLGMPPLNEWNPFPKWAQQVIKNLGIEYQSKVKFDDENRVYKMRVKGDREEFEEFYQKWVALRDEARPTGTEDLKWLERYEIRITATGEDENASLYELDAHHSGYPSAQARGGGIPKNAEKIGEKELAARAASASA